jgi:hypothetical protein
MPTTHGPRKPANVATRRGRASLAVAETGSGQETPAALDTLVRLLARAAAREAFAAAADGGDTVSGGTITHPCAHR